MSVLTRSKSTESAPCHSFSYLSSESLADNTWEGRAADRQLGSSRYHKDRAGEHIRLDNIFRLELPTLVPRVCRNLTHQGTENGN